ncbi:MAG: 2-oxo acid dehydrogenase subunit E2, partial [Actinomycetota bacterium]
MSTTEGHVTEDQGERSGFGSNSWLVEEMYERFVDDPSSVGRQWQEFFADYRSDTPSVAAAAAQSPEVRAIAEQHGDVDAATPLPAPPPPAAAAPAPATPAAATEPPVEEEPGAPIRGAGAAIVRNMEASLEVPTATSFRNVPAKLLEVNRKVINGFRTRSGQGKVSFTHLIGFAVVRAIADALPAMQNTYVEGADGKPRLVENDHVNMALAVDKEKPDGSRTLLTPVIKGADSMDFSEFLGAYNEQIRKVQSNKLTVDDFMGANVSLTNPGTIGTIQSVPRLMPGQGVIVGVGSIDFPAEYEGADRDTLAELGVSKVVTITSTYDHRIIQGAESGLFLKRVKELLLGEHGFYE